MTYEAAQQAAANALSEMPSADYDHVRTTGSGTSYVVEVRLRADHTRWRTYAS